MTKTKKGASAPAKRARFSKRKTGKMMMGGSRTAKGGNGIEKKADPAP